MSKRAEYYLQADYCKRMAERAPGIEGQVRWLDLAAKWLRLADHHDTEAERIDALIPGEETVQERSQTAN